MNNNATITLSTNKLIFSDEALTLLNITAGDKVAVQYYTVDKETTFPVIGTPAQFGISDGNKLTKSNTVSFRGSQNTILAMYGKLFVLEPFKGYFKMVDSTVSNTVSGV